MECGGQRFKKSVPARFRTANRRRESFEAKWEHFFYAAFGIGFRVFPRFDNPRDVSDTLQTMSGLFSVPNITASQTI